jgi:spore maturation protein CgeB
MKVLFSAYHNPHFPTITEYIEDALTRLGHELIIYDDRQHIIPGRMRSRISWLKKLDLKKINHNLYTLALEENPEIVIVAGGHRITGDTIRKLKANGITTVLWTIDAPANFEPVLETAQQYDRIFCQGTEAMAIFKQAGINSTHWLPMACDPKIHYRVNLSEEDKKEYQKDIVFVGSYYPNRWRILKELQNYKLGIWGPNWFKVRERHCNLDFITDAKVRYTEWIKIFSAAKIVIIIHYQDNQIPCYQASPKVFEAMACKSFILVDMQKDVLALFDDGKDLVCYDSISTIKEKIDYYLHCDSEREIIAECGYNKVIQNHTYENRIEELLQKL